MRVLFSKDARGDIARIYEYILERNPVAATRVVRAIQASTIRLANFPRSGRVGGVADTREVVVPRLPYIVVYSIRPDYVEIVAVFHAAQDRPSG